MPQAIKNDFTLRGDKVCVISDLHIGVHQNSIFWHDTALAWAKWLKTELIAKNIKDILFLGDLFHYRDEIAVNTIHVVSQILQIFDSFNILFIVGNHDAFYKDRSEINSLALLNGWKNITVVDKTLETELLGKKCAFVPWGEKIEHLENKDIIFGHFEIESFKMNSYKLCNHGITTASLLDKASLILSGHFHLREERNYDNKKIVYVGNPFQMDFGDIDSTKGYYILDFNSLKLEFFENVISPKHIKLVLTDIIQDKSFKDTIKNNIVKVIINKKISSDNIDTLLKKISVLEPFNLSVDYELAETSLITDDTNFDVSGVDISKAIEEFIGLLDIEDKQVIIDYCIDLYKKSR